MSKEKAWRRPIEDPVASRDSGPLEGIEYTHPAYAQIVAHRTTGSAVLYGSDFVHNQTIRIQIARSRLKRSLANDWHFGDSLPYIEVELSEAQWAHFVSSLNVGTGTQCTLTHRNGETVPGLPKPVDRSSQFSMESDERMQRARQSLKDLGDALMASGMSKVKISGLMSLVHRAQSDIGSNQKFVAEQFGEHIERTVEAAKAEVDGYIHGAIRQVGLQAIAGGAVPIEPLSLEFPNSRRSE